MKKNILFHFALILFFLILFALVTGCGGGGGGSLPVVREPVITLTGNAEVEIAIRGVYTEAGATAEDDEDGDLTPNIIIGGDAVNNGKEGTYTVTYNVIDSNGNSAQEVTRDVIVSYWPTSTPEVQDMDSATLNQMMTYISQNNLDIESVVVVRHGNIVMEEYPDPAFGRETLHVVNSVTKSFVSALIGIGIREGYLTGTDQKMTDLFPGRTIVNLNTWKSAITLDDILTMRPGMVWDEWAFPYDSCANDYVNALWCQADPVQYVLELDMAQAPGTLWNYNGGTTHLLSALVSTFPNSNNTSDTLDFAREFLFEPMDISESAWEYDGNNIIRQGGGGLYLRPRDMAKFGYLYLHNGNWEGNQLIPAGFVADSVATHSYPNGGTSFGYGYQSWWTLPLDGVYYAAGLNGQKIYVIPGLDLVVVFTAYLPGGTDSVQTDLLFDYIIASCNP